jgi:hypothetical protein
MDHIELIATYRLLLLTFVNAFSPGNSPHFHPRQPYLYLRG